MCNKPRPIAPGSDQWRSRRAGGGETRNKRGFWTLRLAWVLVQRELRCPPPELLSGLAEIADVKA